MEKLESSVQADIIKRYEKQGYYVIKLVSTNKNGIPDLLLLKDGKASFIEVKRKGGKPRPLQVYRMQELQERGFEVQLLDK
ncbi:MAG: VRR-NUC domain-containing protein [Phocaeicola sp.]